MIPPITDLVNHNRLEVTEIYNHASVGASKFILHRSFNRCLQHVAVTMRVPALRFMVRDAMPCIEFYSAGDLTSAHAAYSVGSVTWASTNPCRLARHVGHVPQCNSPPA